MMEKGKEKFAALMKNLSGEAKRQKDVTATMIQASRGNSKLKSVFLELGKVTYQLRDKVKQPQIKELCSKIEKLEEELNRINTDLQTLKNRSK